MCFQLASRLIWRAGSQLPLDIRLALHPDELIKVGTEDGPSPDASCATTCERLGPVPVAQIGQKVTKTRCSQNPSLRFEFQGPLLIHARYQCTLLLLAYHIQPKFGVVWHPSTMGPSKDKHLLIVGAGVFGLSTALELKLRGYKHVVVADRYLPPVRDGSSVDISRIVRSEYADPLYHRMAREAMNSWIEGDYHEDFYQSGFVMLAEGSAQVYLQKCLDVSEAVGITLDDFSDANSVRQLYPAVQAKMDGMRAVHNPHGGWANAESAIRRLAGRCSDAGVSFITGSHGTVISLLYKSYNGKRQVVGAKTASGDDIEADQVILATGAWTNRLIPLEHATSASGQPLGFIQLTEEEAARLRGMPVLINYSTGMFVFPPSPGTNLMKVARHGFGWATEVQTRDGRMVSSPRLDASNTGSSYLPDDADKALREGLQQLLPEFAKHPWVFRRMCWYSDTPDADFIIDRHPDIDGLFVATGGSGQ